MSVSGDGEGTLRDGDGGHVVRLQGGGQAGQDITEVICPVFCSLYFLLLIKKYFCTTFVNRTDKN